MPAHRRHERRRNCCLCLLTGSTWIHPRGGSNLLAPRSTQRNRAARSVPPVTAATIATTVAEFAEHQEQKGRQKSKHAAAEWQKRADALDKRIADLESREKTEPQRIVMNTGRTFADEWAEKDTAGRRALLIEAGVRLNVRRGTRGGWRTLDTCRVDFTMSGELDPAAEAVAVVAAEAETETRDDAPPAPGSAVRLAEPAPGLAHAS